MLQTVKGNAEAFIVVRKEIGRVEVNIDKS